MGIQVEFNPDLALRNYSEFEKGNRKKEECIPKEIEAGKEYEFLKKGQRNYWLEGELPLVETAGNQQLSKPLANITIVEVTHLLLEGKPCTKGKYLVNEVFDPKSKKVYFEGFARLK